MTYPNGQGLYGLQPTDAELDDLLEVLDEVEAEEALGEQELANDYGPWDDYVDLSGGLERASAALDASMTTEAQRQAADLTDALERRPSSERKLARALERIADGSYTTPAYYRAPEPEYGCGQGYDSFGRCAARFHDAGCLETARQEAATGSARAVEAWRTQLLANQAVSPVDLAAPALDTSWEDLLGGDGAPGVPADWSTIGEMRKILGLPADPAPPNPARFTPGEA